MPVVIVFGALFVLFVLAGCAYVACTGHAADGARPASSYLEPWQEDRHAA